MNAELWANFMDKSHSAEILDQNRIHSCSSDFSHMLFELQEFVCKDECVECYISNKPSSMQQLHQARQILKGEIDRSRTSVKAGFQPEVNGIGTVFDCGVDTFPVSCRG